MPRWKDHLQTLANRLGYRVERMTERKKITLLRSVIQRNGIDLVVDVGGHRGEFATTLRQEIGYAGTILSIEPNPECVEDIKTKSSGDPHWDVVNVAAGDQATILPFLVTRRTTFSSFFEPSGLFADRFGDSMAKVNTIPTEVKRLDQIVPERYPEWRERRIFLKCDTQGFDSQVLKGSYGIGEAVRSVQVELAVLQLYKGSPPYHSVLSILAGMGFTPVDFLVLSREEDSIVEMDGLFQRMPG